MDYGYIIMKMVAKWLKVHFLMEMERILMKKVFPEMEELVCGFLGIGIVRKRKKKLSMMENLMDYGLFGIKMPKRNLKGTGKMESRSDYPLNGIKMAKKWK